MEDKKIPPFVPLPYKTAAELVAAFNSGVRFLLRCAMDSGPTVHQVSSMEVHADGRVCAMAEPDCWFFLPDGNERDRSAFYSLVHADAQPQEKNCAQSGSIYVKAEIPNAPIPTASESSQKSPGKTVETGRLAYARSSDLPGIHAQAPAKNPPTPAPGFMVDPPGKSNAGLLTLWTPRKHL